MAHKWFPIIDTAVCENCGDCVSFCQHGVFQTGREAPRVVSPDSCVEFCRGCSKICPNGAIDYFTEVQPA